MTEQMQRSAFQSESSFVSKKINFRLIQLLNTFSGTAIATIAAAICTDFAINASAQACRAKGSAAAA